jgi:hypothetical protein
MTLFSMARPVAFKVPRAQALPTPFRPNCCNRVITHEREWLSFWQASDSRPARPSEFRLRAAADSRTLVGALPGLSSAADAGAGAAEGQPPEEVLDASRERHFLLGGAIL